MLLKLDADELKLIRMLGQNPNAQRLVDLLKRQLNKTDELLRRASSDVYQCYQGRAQQLDELIKVLQQHSDD